jgi:hypothetical protein
MLKRISAVLVAAGCVALASNCSSSNNTGATCPPGDVCTKTPDSGVSASSGAFQRFDDAATTKNDGAVSMSTGFDGTTGLACSSDAQCQPDGGAGVNMCSSTYGGSVVSPAGVMAAIFATPVCMVPLPSSTTTGNCDPGTDNTQIHFCDGPDDASLVGTAGGPPGLCVPNDFNAPMTNQGICYPVCTFALDGSAAKGCAGHNACLPVTFLLDSTNNTALGVGYCTSACQTDADCSGLGANFGCEADVGYCTQTKKTRTKTPGQACALPTDDTSGACFCDASATSMMGYCSALCLVGGTPCPGGWVCDTGEPSLLDFGAGAPQIPVTKENPGLVGVCSPSCSSPTTDGGTGAGDGGSASDAGTSSAGDGGSCSAGSTCSASTVAGPDCVFQ